jgi:hypothetical protein
VVTTFPMSTFAAGTPAPEALRLVDEAVVLDNSGLYPVRVLLLQMGRIVWRADVLPEWVQGLSLTSAG